jgi:hypothetical protein
LRGVSAICANPLARNFSIDAKRGFTRGFYLNRALHRLRVKGLKPPIRNALCPSFIAFLVKLLEFRGGGDHGARAGFAFFLAEQSLVELFLGQAILLGIEPRALRGARFQSGFGSGSLFRAETVEKLIGRVVDVAGDQGAALSSVGLTELVHGIYRAQTPEIYQRRRAFLEELLRNLTVYAYAKDTAMMAGKVDGEDQARE